MTESRFDVVGFAIAAVRAALDAAAGLAEARTGRRPKPSLHDGEAVVAFASERYARSRGWTGGMGFAELSRFAQTADGWIRLHANYPQHRAALLSVLGDADPIRAAASWEALALEDAIIAAGGCAAAVRTATEWSQSAAGRAAATPRPRRRLAAARGLPAPTGALPASGLRVLDLTRVIAGPVGGRYLAALGADVTRIDPPHMPELALHVADGNAGKRVITRDLRAAPLTDRELDGLDAIIHGYRPGALAALGIDMDVLAERHPHLTIVQLSAWGTDGPWGSRRGFDSLVQAASGIADALAGTNGAPGALPVQALDHASGYRIAAAVLEGLTSRAREGVAQHAWVALAGTAADLMERPGDRPWPDPPAPHTQDLGDNWIVACPPGSLDGIPLRYP